MQVLSIFLPLKSKGQPISAITIYSFILGSVGIFALAVGAIQISLIDLMQGQLSELHQTVLTQIRLPRVLLAGIVGSGLAVAGAVMQGLFRNPLADPGLIGVSSGAALAVAIVIVLVGSMPGILGLYGMGFAAFTGGILTSIVIFRIAAFAGSFSVTYLLLAGIAINALSGAATGFLTYLSDDQQLRSFTFWTMGSFGGALWPAVIVSSTITFPTLFIMMKSARKINILMLGEEEARNLGVDTKSLKRIIIVGASVIVGVSVAVSGMIGFVGLLVPHLIRLLISSDNRLLIPLSALMGAILLILADTFARIIVAPAEMPVGILTSMIGGPFFLWLLMRQFSNRFGI